VSRFADFEISLRRSEDGGCTVEFRYTQVEDEADLRPEPGAVQLDLGILASQLTPDAYAKCLTEAFFHDRAVAIAGRDVKSDFCRWNDSLLDNQTYPSFLDESRTYRPDAQHPLVYHLYGRLSEPDSLVLTEDDYFDYLIGATANKGTIPEFVRRALADSLLLFLRFRLEEWKFGVLFRSIMRQEGGARRNKYPHVAAQIDPEEGRILEPERARKYLEGYFQGSSANIFWGSVSDFVTEWIQRMAGAAAA